MRLRASSIQKALIGALVFATMAFVPQARANTYVVDTTSDSPSLTACTSSGGDCSLRGAMADANTAGGSNTITFDGVVFNPGTITLSSALPTVTSQLAIEGIGSTNTIVQASSCNPVTLPGGCTPASYGVLEISSAGALTISGMTLENGHSAGAGGAIYNNGGSLNATDVVFSGNAAESHGGALSTDSGGSSTLLRTIFSGNSAHIWGGAVWVDTGTHAITDSQFKANLAPYGAGIAMNSGDVSVDASTFSGNIASGTGGGGIYMQNSGTVLNVVNSTFNGNTAANGDGGAIMDSGSSSVDIINSTIAGNSANNAGGLYNAGTANLYNSIVAGSASGGDCNNAGTMQVQNSLVEDGSCGVGAGSNGNLSGDPLLYPLADNGGPTQTMALQGGSPAINAGDNALALDGTGVPLSTDQRGAGYPRSNDQTVDMGAYETRLCYVDAGVNSPVNNGLTWATAYTDLQSALQNQKCTQIWVAKGIYKPGKSESDSFVVLSGVQLIGGFDNGDSTVGQRVPAIPGSILSGDIGGDDTVDGNGVTANYSDIKGTNAYNVVTMDGTSTPILSDTVLDGFTITGGDAQGDFPNSGGGGLLCNASYNAGAFVVGECNPTLRNLTFSGNNSSDVGGAIYALGAGAASSPSLDAVTFRGNHAVNDGGALYLDGSVGGISTASLINVSFSGNQADGNGGALYDNGGGSSGSSSPMLINVTFNGNNAYNGGAIFNTAAGGGSSAPTLTNVILWGDAASSLGAEIYDDGATTNINYSIVQGGDNGSNTGTAFSAGTGNLQSDPSLGMLSDNGGFTETMALPPGSPAVDTGTNTGCPATDQRGVTRPQGPTCDIGAYELLDEIFRNGFEGSP